MLERIRKKPLLLFFTLSFTISWATWFTAAALTGNQGPLLGAIDLAGAFAPAVSAIAIAKWLNPQPANNSATKRRVTFAVFFTTSLLIQLAASLVSNNFSYPLTALSAATSLLIAYVVSSVYHPNAAVAEIMRTLKPSGRRVRWVLAAFLLPFAFQFLGGAAGYILGESPRLNISPASIISLIASYPLIMLIGGPLGEEPGWRGYATPRLGESHTPLVTGLIVGAIWSTWHLPLHLTAFYGDGLNGFLLRYAFNIPLGILFTWLYYKSKGSLFACLLLHTGVNVSPQIYTTPTNSSLYSNLIMVAFTLIVVVKYKMHRKTNTILNPRSSCTISEQAPGRRE